MGYAIVKTNGVLVHHGVKGMKWGVRRYQNPDGTIKNPKGRKYYNKDGSLNTYGEIKKAYYSYKVSKRNLKNSQAYKEAKLREKIRKRVELNGRLQKDYDKAYGPLDKKLRERLVKNDRFWNRYAKGKTLYKVADKMKAGKPFQKAQFEAIGSRAVKRTGASIALNLAPYAVAAGVGAYNAYKKRKKIPKLTQKKYFDPIDVAYKVVR